MKDFVLFLVLTSGLVCTQAGFAKSPVETTIGIESYQETYREYENGERFMQQEGRLNALNGSVKYHLDNNQSIRLEGRYAKGKVDYTGGENPSDENPDGTPYGSVHQNNLPRRAYDIRSVYALQKPIHSNMSMIAEAGLGHRVLKDLSSRQDSDDYDRKNKTTYAQIGVGLNIALPHDFEITPKISYNRSIHARQYSYLDDGVITLKQHNAHGLEIEVPITKKFTNQHKVSYTPYYRNWRVPTSDVLTRIEQDEDGDDALATYKEPKNRTNEIGVKLQYTF